MMTATAPKTPKLYACVKRATKKTTQIKDIIKSSFGNETSVPQTIYDRIQKNINSGKEINAFLKVKLKDGSSHWVDTLFTPGQPKNNKTFSVKSNIINEQKLTKLKKLYRTLVNIEKKVSVNQANKYLDGFLEAYQINFNQLSKLI